MSSLAKQRAALLHIVQDHGVGLVGHHAGILAGVLGVAALVVHGHHHVHAVALAGLIVVGAEAGSGVDAAGTGVHGDVVRQQQTGGLGQEGMVRQHVLEESARDGSPGSHRSQSRASLHDLVGQGLGHDIHLAVGGLHHGIGLLGDAARWPGCPAGSRWWWSRSRRRAWTCPVLAELAADRRAWGTSHTRWCRGRPDTRSRPQPGRSRRGGTSTRA